jgi:predicted adenylyl cyclase CyaB
MQEVEVKILEVNRPSIEKTLAGLGAKKVFDGDIKTLFFDFKDGAIVKARDVLRLRKEQDETELTYKKVHVTKAAKVAQEYTVEVSDLETMKDILANLGLAVTECMQKHRVSYEFGTARFDFDAYTEEYAFIPEFLEIEAEDAVSIQKYAALFGFGPEKCLPWSTNDIIQYYKNKSGY